MSYVKELFVSIDVEADGKIPGEFSMVSLGAVLAGTYDSDHVVTKFDLDDPANCFRYDFKPISDNWDAELWQLAASTENILSRTGATRLRL